MPGVFAAGDVRSGSIKRVASAVGEGSTARTKNLDPGVIIDAIMVAGTLMGRSGIASTILGSMIMTAAAWR